MKEATAELSLVFSHLTAEDVEAAADKVLELETREKTAEFTARLNAVLNPELDED